MVLYDSLQPSHTVFMSCLTASLAAGLFGFDTGSIGAITTMPQFEEKFGVLSPLLRGFVVAVILIPSALTGIVAGNVSDRLSRKRTIGLGSAIFAVGSAVCTGCETLSVLIVGRCIAGAGEGLFLSCIGVYICEISPKHLRGRNVLLIQLFTAGSIAAGFFVCYGAVKIQSSLSWRFPFMLSTATALFLAGAAPFLPYSPRWLMTKGRRGEAERMLDLLTGTESTEERVELLAVGASPSGAQKVAFLTIFEKGVRGRTILAIFLNIFQQLSGIDFVLFFAPLLFTQAGLDPKTASFLASGMTGILLLCTTMVGASYIDKIGRRTLFLAGGCAISLCHLSLGTLYATGGARGRIGKWFVVAFIELFALSFSASWSLVVRLYSSEIQPSRTRATAASFAQGTNQAFNFLVALSAPAFLAKSSFGPYLLYGGLSAFATVVAFFYMPETIGKSLERIDDTFDGSPLAVTWPEILRPGGNSQIRQRIGRTNRYAAQSLPAPIASLESHQFGKAIELQEMDDKVLVNDETSTDDENRYATDDSSRYE